MLSHPPTSLPGYYSGTKLILAISTIGTIAGEALAHTDQASVIGKTSCGLFLHLASDWVVFLSFEPYRGPLTLNLSGKSKALTDLEIGALAQCLTESITFPSIHLTLPLFQAASWQAPEPAFDAIPRELLRARLLSCLRQASMEFPDHQLVALLLGMLSGQPAPNPTEPDFYPLLKRLLAACRVGQADAVSTSLEAFLGLGHGLTPSGDDLIMGYLLAMSRWGQRQDLPHDVALFSQHLALPLRQLTSDLSASLVLCAARGQADERLVSALDGAVTGSLEAEKCVAGLATWGSSSGLDALAGMAIFLMQGQS